MPLPESTQAATLSFDAAVHRALSRRLSDTPYPHSGSTVILRPAATAGDVADRRDASTGSSAASFAVGAPA